jgi:hypothetical protein
MRTTPKALVKIIVADDTAQDQDLSGAATSITMAG